jgi:hypothetical protein
MALRPAKHDENKGGTGGFACPERAREAERIGPVRNGFSTVLSASFAGDAPGFRPPRNFTSL